MSVRPSAGELSKWNLLDNCVDVSKTSAIIFLINGESERCYSKSPELHPQSPVFDNKARMLRDWAGRLLSEQKNHQANCLS